MPLKMDAVPVVMHLRNLATDPQNRASIVTDKSCLAGLILFLSHQDTRVVQSSLETIHLLCGNPAHCEIMKNELGMMVSLENIMNSCDLSEKLQQLAQKIYISLSPPAHMCTPETNSRKNKPQFFITSSNKRAKTITFHIHGLDNVEMKALCEEALLKVKGVISFTFQLAIRRCTVRVKPDLATECLASAIAETKVLRPQQVIKTESGKEMYVPLTKMHIASENNLHLPDYLPEEESPPKELEKAITRTGSKDDSRGSWINTAATFLTKTFYW
ncbi:armadillo repeat-containing protein 1-like isoform 1-T2 [Discoglossus pictus]